jgi:chorismate synthase
MSIRVLTAGESHGKSLTAIIEGLPANIEISKQYIDYHLQRRKKGYGRGGRMKIESDQVEILAGVRHGYTIGSPVSLSITNKDWVNWEVVMSSEPVDLNSQEVLKRLDQKKIEHVRPGHADLAGYLKYDQTDVRNVLERSSARETAARVAAYSISRKLLESFNVHIFSHVKRIGSAAIPDDYFPENFKIAAERAENSEVRCLIGDVEQRMKEEIDKAKETGDSLGGMIQIIAYGLPVGLGSYVHWDKRLDGIIAQAVMSVPAIKSVEIGMGSKVAEIPGSQVHDEFLSPADGSLYNRKTNNAGGLEGGMTNGMPLVINAAMKPIPTLKKPLQSVNIYTGEEHVAHYERSDVCAVPSAGIVCEAVLAHVLANAFIEKFGGDSIKEISTNYKNYTNISQVRS